MAEIILLQTADAYLYSEMLKWSGVPNKLYADKWNLRYQAFFGIKRGYFPWHATFNRIMLLKELTQSNYRGWVFYLDADAYVFDLDFDLYGYLEGLDSSVAMVVGPGAHTGLPWDINIGVFLINLAHERSQEIITLWHDHFMSTSDDSLRAASEWTMVPCDQTRLQELLQTHSKLTRYIKIEERERFNHPAGTFVRQIGRSNFLAPLNVPEFEQRTDRIKSDVKQILERYGISQVPSVNDSAPSLAGTSIKVDELVSSLYRAVLGRDPDPIGLSYYAGLITQGSPISSIVREFLTSPERVHNLAKRGETISAHDCDQGVSTSRNFAVRR